MRVKGTKADYAVLDNKPVIGLFKNQDRQGKIRYYYFYRDGKRVTATSNLAVALHRFFTQQEPPREVKLNQLSLSDCFTKYLNLRRDKPLSVPHRRLANRSFNQFKQIVAKEYVHQITFKDIERYNSTIYLYAKGVDRPDIFVNHRYQIIKAVFNQVMAKEEFKDDLQQLLLNLKILDTMKFRRTEVNTVSKEQFHELYKKTEGITRLMLLLGLNASYTAIDIISLKKSMINLEAKTITRYRHKTDIVQVCCLWDETVEAIKDYIRGNPNNSEYLLLSRNGEPYSTQITEHFWRPVSPNISHRILRPTFKTVATELDCNDSKIRLVLGHTIPGISDHYLAKRANMTKQVCQVVHDYFFTNSSQDKHS